MIKYHIHELEFYKASLCYQILYDFYMKLKSDIDSLNQNDSKLITSVQNLSGEDLFSRFIYFLNISPPNKETIDTLKDVEKKYHKEMEDYPTLGKLIAIKNGDNIVQITNDYLIQFNSVIFKDDPELFILGINNSKLFRKYLIQKNL